MKKNKKVGSTSVDKGLNLLRKRQEFVLKNGFVWKTKLWKIATKINNKAATDDLVIFSIIAEAVHILSHKTNPIISINGANVAARIPSTNPIFLLKDIIELYEWVCATSQILYLVSRSVYIYIYIYTTICSHHVVFLLFFGHVYTYYICDVNVKRWTNKWIRSHHSCTQGIYTLNFLL